MKLHIVAWWGVGRCSRCGRCSVLCSTN